jgi:hypothetical protein
MVNPELVAEIAQEHEPFLNELEGLAVEAIATNDWTAFYAQRRHRTRVNAVRQPLC